MYIRKCCLSLVISPWVSTIFCSPAAPGDKIHSKPLSNFTDSANITASVASIPSDFSIEPRSHLPMGFSQEACFINLIATLRAAALGDFTKKMPTAAFRTARYPQPVIQIGSPDLRDVPRSYVAWGLFLIAFYINSHNAFHFSYFSLRWKGEEVGGIGVGGRTFAGDIVTTSLAAPSNLNILIDFEFFGSQDLGKGAVFMTIISALMEAAPPAIDTPLQGPWIHYLANEPCYFVVTPSAAARATSSLSFENQDLIDLLLKAAEYYVRNNAYRQLSMNISFDGVLVAQAAFIYRPTLGALNFAAAGEQGTSTSIV